MHIYINSYIWGHKKIALQRSLARLVVKADTLESRPLSRGRVRGLFHGSFSNTFHFLFLKSQVFLSQTLVREMLTNIIHWLFYYNFKTDHCCRVRSNLYPFSSFIFCIKKVFERIVEGQDSSSGGDAVLAFTFGQFLP